MISSSPWKLNWKLKSWIGFKFYKDLRERLFFLKKEISRHENERRIFLDLLLQKQDPISLAFQEKQRKCNMATLSENRVIQVVLSTMEVL